jgi:hypothetical protein|tara:strand:- start:74 stop:373 length:300 start_codon:yes stop_codon:yes gene_type:complete
MTDWKLIQLNQNKSYFVTDDSTGEELEIQGELMELVRGVNYVMNFYKDTEGFTSDSVLKTIIKVLEIERLRGIGDNSFSVDSFIRENVFDILTRELDNK